MDPNKLAYLSSVPHKKETPILLGLVIHARQLCSPVTARCVISMAMDFFLFFVSSLGETW